MKMHSSKVGVSAVAWALQAGALGLGLVASGCASDADVLPSGEQAGVRKEFIDERGIRWTLVGKATIVAMSAEDPALDDGLPTEASAAEPTTVEELAESLRARTERDGYEYVSDPNYALAERLLAGHVPDPILPSGPAELVEGEAGAEAEAGASPRHNTHAFIGADNRIQVTAPTTYPHSAIAAWQSGFCTGTMIGASSMITAAHCLHDGQNWFGAPTVVFPSGATATCWNRSVRTPWITGSVPGDFRYDIGVIEFSSCSLSPGNATAWLGVWNFNPTTQINGVFGYAWGYPQDKTPYPQQWGMGSTLSYTSSQPQYVFQTIDGHFGQSGSGVYRMWNTSEGAPVTGRYITSIYNRTWDTTKNAAARIDGNAAAFIIDFTAL